MEITQEDFVDFENIRKSGATNMFDINKVISLSRSLDKEKCLKIMKEYKELKEKYLSKKKFHEQVTIQKRA